SVLGLLSRYAADSVSAFTSIFSGASETRCLKTSSNPCIKNERTRLQTGLSYFPSFFWCVCRSSILRFLCNPFHFSAIPAGLNRVAMYESKPLSQLPCMETGVLFYLTSPHHKEEH
ncbi:MAG TPA: hypothetical protein VI424_03040, partial [Terriglobales bacterium]